MSGADCCRSHSACSGCRGVCDALSAGLCSRCNDDESVDMVDVQHRYGHRFIKAVQGTVSQGENDGKKLLVLYYYRSPASVSMITVLELDPTYDTTLRAEEQGFDIVMKNNHTYQVYPIKSVIKNPE